MKKGFKIHIAPFRPVRIGIPAEENEKKIRLDDIALWVEHGVMERLPPAQPARAFLLRSRLTILQDKKLLKELITDPESFGKKGVEIMKNIMNTGDFPPLSESTLRNRERGGNKSIQPTVDTGELRDSIIYEVVDNDKK